MSPNPVLTAMQMKITLNQELSIRDFDKGYRVVEGAKRKLDGYSKRFRYCMSHKSGKIEVVGIDRDNFYFKYHQARYLKDIGRFFTRKMDKKAGWLDELK